MTRNTQLSLAIAGVLGMYLASTGTAHAGVVCEVTPDGLVTTTTGGSTATGLDASACGILNQANAEGSAAFGNNNLISATAVNSSGFGFQNSITSDGDSNAFGSSNTVSGPGFANAFGSGNEASNFFSNAFGTGNTASGD